MNDVLMEHQANLWHIPDHLGDNRAYDRKANKITFMVAPAHVCKANLKHMHIERKAKIKVHLWAPQPMSVRRT